MSSSCCLPPKNRSDIQGLRAIAVIAVILFHAKKEFMPGGFVG
jgi:peptidoglycan/LPS O-acetylase OafA/YrhL